MQSEAEFSDERTLLIHLQSGNPAAKRWLYDRYAAPMYGLLLQLAPDEQKARELLVKVFTWIFENIEEYYQSNGLSLFSWLLKKTREISISECPDIELTGNESNTLIQFSETLDEQCRQVFVLCYCKGLPRSTVAKKLEISEQQVYQLLKEAMIAFRKFSAR